MEQNLQNKNNAENLELHKDKNEDKDNIVKNDLGQKYTTNNEKSFPQENLNSIIQNKEIITNIIKNFSYFPILYPKSDIKKYINLETTNNFIQNYSFSKIGQYKKLPNPYINNYQQNTFKDKDNGLNHTSINSENYLKKESQLNSSIDFSKTKPLYLDINKKISKKLIASPKLLQYLSKNRILSFLEDKDSTQYLQNIIKDKNIPKETITKIVDRLSGTYLYIIKDKNGNYLLRDLIKNCEQSDRIKILKELYKTISDDCTNKYATYPIQEIIMQSQTEEEFNLILYSFKDYNKTFVASLDPNSSFVIQKIISQSRVNTCNSHKNIFIKMDDRKRKTLNSFNKFMFSEKSITPSSMYISDRGEKNFYMNKKQINITPTDKYIKTKENIENYFLNIYQSIFFYGNNGYLNMLKISDKLLKRINDGICKYRFNIIEIKEYCIKYISYTIIPIVNDFNTKPYQRKIIKDKIRTVLDALRIDPNYFDKDYKIFYEEKKEKQYDERSFNGFNITHAKINEFRKFYDLKEKEYPDEQIIKALIRYRGNRELAFQYLFY